MDNSPFPEPVPVSGGLQTLPWIDRASGRGESPQPRLKLESCFHSLIQISLFFNLVDRVWQQIGSFVGFKRIPEMEASGRTWRWEVFCSDIVTMSYRTLQILSFLWDELETQDKCRQLSDLEAFPVLFRWLHLF